MHAWKSVFDRCWYTFQYEGSTLVSGLLKRTPLEIGGPRDQVRPPLATVRHRRGAWRDTDHLTTVGVGLQVVCGFGLAASLREPRKGCIRENVMGR